MLIFDVCYSDRAPGNCLLTPTNAVLDDILTEVKERQITATACNLKIISDKVFLKKVGTYVLQCMTMLAQSATKLLGVKIQGLQN